MILKLRNKNLLIKNRILTMYTYLNTYFYHNVHRPDSTQYSDYTMYGGASLSSRCVKLYT